MYAYEKMPHVPHSYSFRWTARASAAVLFAIWVTLFAYELSHLRLTDYAMNTYGQAACLVVVFAGYLIGLRRELAGGIVAILGTLAFVVVVSTTTQVVPGAALLFALPGVLYVLSWHYDERRRLLL